MIVYDAEQGSQGWHDARIGKITASMFEECCRVVGGLSDQQQKYVDAVLAGKDKKDAQEIAGYKSAPRSSTIERALKGEQVGDFSDTAKKYAKRLAFERVTGKLLGMEDQFETAAMRRGKELEPEARLLHEDMLDTLIQHCSMVASDDEFFGASADGLVGDDEVVEYKCFTDADKVFRIRVERSTEDATYQIQGQLWLTERKRARYCHYHPEMDPPLYEIEVERDDKFIAGMVKRLTRFNQLVEEYRQQIIDAAKPAGDSE